MYATAEESGFITVPTVKFSVSANFPNRNDVASYAVPHTSAPKNEQLHRWSDRTAAPENEKSRTLLPHL